MNDVGRTIVFAMLSLSITVILVLRGPVGRALADRIAGRRDPVGEDELLRADLEGMKQRLADVEERLDFAERLLTKQREADRIVPPR